MDSGFVLPNVGPGPDPLSLWDLEAEFAVLLLHRDFYCSECRQQVRRVKKRYDEFESRDAEVVSVLPEARDTAAEWQKQYHLPFPVVADPDTELGERYEQPTRFGLLGRLHDVIGRMPAVVVLDLRWSEPSETYAHRGDSRTDRPRIDEVLDALDHAATLDADEASPEGDPTAESRGIDTVPPAASSGPTTAVPSAGPETPADSPKPPTDGDTAASAEGEPPKSAATGDTPEHAPTDDTPERAELDDSPERTEPTETPERTEPNDIPPEESTPAEDSAEVIEHEHAPKPQRPLEAPDHVALPETVDLRRGANDDVVAAMRVLQGALLDIDGSTVRDAAPDGEVLLAEEGDWVVGALVMREGHIEGVAVRRERRGQGIGSALVETAVADEGGTVTADFRAGVRGFWKDLGFEVEQEGGRFWGRRTVD